MRKSSTPKSVPVPKSTTLQRVLTTAVNDLGMDTTVAVLNHADGPFISQVAHGFSDREVQAVLRALSRTNWVAENNDGGSSGSELNEALRLRVAVPSSKTLLAVPLKDGSKIYGVVVLGKREGSTFSKRERASINSVRESITNELRKAQLFDESVILNRPNVVAEPLPKDQEAQIRSYTSPQVQTKISELLTEAQATISFERGWVTLYDPLAASLQVLGCLAGHKKELVPGQNLSLHESASGWAVRHRKSRIDHNLASTQGRFQDYKQLYRDKYRCTLVVPFFVRGRVGGTVTLSSKTADQYESPESESGKLESITTQLAQFFEDPSYNLSVFSAPSSLERLAADSSTTTSSEPAIRRQERQAALNEVSSFLAAEIREPMGFIRAQLEEVTGEGSLDFEVQTRVEGAMRDLIRMESLLNEILDFAKPLELDRRLCKIPNLIDEALSLISTDVKVNRIEVTKEFPARLGQVRWDIDKMRHVFLSIFKNALEAMSPGGHLRVSASQRRGRQPAIIIRVHNDGALIPEDLLEKVFEPYFTTKWSGTGLGLAMVKKIVEEHQGRIAIESHSEKGTTVELRLPTLRPKVPYRRRGGPPRRPPQAVKRGE
ncbi:MAG: ATP-binding protein [Nitrospirota bacterium]|nr:ATP-binding protein [Nitrospirota bacterium]